MSSKTVRRTKSGPAVSKVTAEPGEKEIRDLIAAARAVVETMVDDDAGTPISKLATEAENLLVWRQVDVLKKGTEIMKKSAKLARENAKLLKELDEVRKQRDRAQARCDAAQARADRALGLKLEEHSGADKPPEVLSLTYNGASFEVPLFTETENQDKDTEPFAKGDRIFHEVGFSATVLANWGDGRLWVQDDYGGTFAVNSIQVSKIWDEKPADLETRLLNAENERDDLRNAYEQTKAEAADIMRDYQDLGQQWYKDTEALEQALATCRRTNVEYAIEICRLGKLLASAELVVEAARKARFVQALTNELSEALDAHGAQANEPSHE